MPQIIAYLGFNGNCREAMNFYKDCFGGDLSIMTMGGSPMAASMPPEKHDLIMHSSLTNGSLSLLGSDMKDSINIGDNVTMMIECGSDEEINSLYSKLAEGGQADMPPADMFWGAVFGHLVDKYGFNWALNWQKTPLVTP